MYNKCDKCGKLLTNYEERKLILDNAGKISTRCMNCYETYSKLKA